MHRHTKHSVNSRPYISFVVAARNDNYGGDFNQRFEVFVNHLSQSAEWAGLDAELVVVNWNPPLGKDSLPEAIVWRTSASLPIRIITVDPEIHRKLLHSDRTEMFEYIAKNVGIRRSRGTFVLVTNPDILFSSALLRKLAKQDLVPTAFYRVDRYDYKGRVSLTASRRRVLAYARRHVYRVHFRHRPASSKIIQGCSADITTLERWKGILVGSWPGSHDTLQLPSMSGLDVPMDDDTGFYGGVYTNASGDFLLAARSKWELIRAFPEYTDLRSHLDAYACNQFVAAGLQQRFLRAPCMALHADHGREGSKTLSTDRDWDREQQAIRDGRLGPQLNDEGWGLDDTPLPEENP